MFRKKTKWYVPSIRAFLFAGVLYKIARLFMKSTERQVKMAAFDFFPARRRSRSFRVPFGK
jgi:hypothetical protein